MAKITQFIRLYLPVILWSAVIFWFSSRTTLPSAVKIWWDYLAKKTAHMVEYAILYFLTYRALKPHTHKAFLYAFIYAFLYAASDEFHQSFTPGRHPSPYDVGFDTIGISFTYLRLKKFI